MWQISWKKLLRLKTQISTYKIILENKLKVYPKYLRLFTKAKFEHFDAISKVVQVNPNFPMSVGKKEFIMSIQILASKTSKLVRLSNIEMTSE